MTSAKVIQIIRTESSIEVRTNENPCRELIQYWDFDGKLLAQRDPWFEIELEERGLAKRKSK